MKKKLFATIYTALFSSMITSLLMWNLGTNPAVSSFLGAFAVTSVSAIAYIIIEK
jgi:uncharacterized membrane protein YjjB (DUF3815 family)